MCCKNGECMNSAVAQNEPRWPKAHIELTAVSGTVVRSVARTGMYEFGGDPVNFEVSIDGRSWIAARAGDKVPAPDTGKLFFRQNAPQSGTLQLIHWEGSAMAIRLGGISHVR